jgi:hypothetical protein
VLTEGEKEWVFLQEAVAAVVVSAVHQAGGWLQELQLLLQKAVCPFDENAVAASLNWDQKVHPLQTVHDQEALNTGERLQMMSLPELHYTSMDREMPSEYELPPQILLKNTNSRCYNFKL